MARFASYLAACFLIPGEPASAWSNQGHMATGAIAYDLLASRDPAAVASITALVAQHPDRSRFELALGNLTGAPRDRALFELIARWPDDIRKTAYNHTHWHHQLRVVVGTTAFKFVRLGEADHAFSRNLKIVSDDKADPGRRAIALCWLFHVLGDMHQPLHAGHRIGGRFPLTDRAGTLGWVRRGPDAAPETLHHFWDQAADREGDEAAGANSIARAAEAAAETVSVTLEQDPTATYRLAVKESEILAATIAYQGVALAESPRPADAPVLTQDYVTAARRAGEQRIGQAGARLADMLGALFSDGNRTAIERGSRDLPPAAMLHPEQ
ncbi:S1/P1 nuclease [Sphingomonas crusticola]|uniref:S1/P1 nuclease n=1 Tax=Sphingomonas crusticola TaxID=1697973 RepID=UPI000E262988|nr:S1/P1 nuclease [Sphingomonas crusticola]